MLSLEITVEIFFCQKFHVVGHLELIPDYNSFAMNWFHNRYSAFTWPSVVDC